MSLRVVHWGTGNVGLPALRQVLDHPELELVGLWVHSPDKLGRDAGEIAGGPPVGVTATGDIEELLALNADCLVHIGRNPDIVPPAEGTNSAQALDEICRFLESGTNVVCTTLTPLIWPHSWGPEPLRRLEKAAAVGGTTFRNVGLHPGFMCDGLVSVMTANSRRIDAIRCEQVLNYTTYDEPERLRMMGYGAPVDAVEKAFVPGVFLNTYASVLHLLAEALGVELDDVTEEVEFAPTDHEIVLPSMTVAAGTVGAFRFRLTGFIDGQDRLSLEHASRLSDDIAPHWPRIGSTGGYRATIEGDPAMRISVEFGIDGADPLLEACVASAALVTNAVPPTCRAEPGVRSFLDVVPTTGRGMLSEGGRAAAAG